MIKYNQLNLPEQLNLNLPQHYYEICYLYTAAGQKLHKATHTAHTPATTTDYIGSFVYEDNKLQYLLTAEGRIVFAPDGTHEYQYFLKDHLGNTRITFNDGGIIQEDSYYPFGLSMAGLSHQTGGDLPNKFLYNGKELQDDFGLEWYDYGARFYDAQIGRWHVIDNKAEKYSSFTPYAYAINSPIIFLDPDGQEIKIFYRDKNNEIQKFHFNGANAKSAPKNLFVKNTIAAYNYNVINGGGKNLQYAATNSDGIDIQVYQTNEGNSFGPATTVTNGKEAVEMFIFFNPDRGKTTSDGVETSPATALEHEADHAVAAEKDLSGYIARSKDDKKNPYGSEEEERVCTGSESETAIANKEAPQGWVRPDHEGKPVIKKEWEYKKDD